MKPKKYSFFIEGELVELTIDKEDDVFNYDLLTNEKVDTARNQRVKKEKKRNLIYSLLFIVGLVGFMILVAFLLLRKGIL